MAEDRQGFEKGSVVGAVRPIGQVSHHEIRREEIATGASCPVGLRCAIERKAALLEELVLENKALVEGRLPVRLANDRADETMEERGVQVLAHLERHLRLFRERRRHV